MALDQQTTNLIEGIISSFDNLYEAGDRLRSFQQGATDAGVGQPADVDLQESGYDWFGGIDIVAAFSQITTILATLDDPTIRQAVNKVRRFP